MKIALIQTNPVIGDFARNTALITARLTEAKEAGCELAILPELAISGYPPQDLLERAAFLADHQRAVNELVASTHGIGVICGALTPHQDRATGKPLHNSAILFADGEILFTAHKRLLPTYDVFDESRYFEPAQKSKTFSFRGLRLGITICEDIWNDKDIFTRQLYDCDPVAELVNDPAGQPELLINIAASPFQIGKAAMRRQIFETLCHKYKTPFCYVNQAGGQDSLLFDGNSLALDANGNELGHGDSFSEDMIVIDTEATPSQAAPPTNETTTLLAALIMGTRDYVHKCGFKKGLLGLSGGIDSALTAVIAARALGPENVLGVALPSPYTSQASIDDARQLAENLGIDFELVPITDVFEAHKKTLGPLFGDRPEDVTEQNIQARIRGNLLMALSNKFGHLLLSTGNKSEMAVGYCTLYGDMSGGLAVISDVPKGLVYELSRHINREEEIIPWNTIERAPSAELAPDQVDQDDLPPYEILDQIITAYLEEHRSFDEIVGMGFEAAAVADIIRRIRINEYKRKQAPMGLKVTSKAFGPGRRYPTAQNYREEQ